MSRAGADPLAGARVLVTGGSGFIGRHLVRALQEAHAAVRVLDLQPHPDPAVELIQGDVGESDVLAAALEGGCDAVVHLAAVTSVLRSLQQPELTFATNVAATHRLLLASRAAGCKALAFASTNAAAGPMRGAALDEAAVPAPLTPYGATKAASEMLMSAFSASLGLRCASLRLTNVYGLGMQAKDSIVARLMRAIRLGREFEVYGDGTQVRDYVNALDVVEGFLRSLRDERWRGPVVIGSGHSLSVLEVVDAVRLVTGERLEVTHGPARAGEMPAVIVDPSHARGLGWTNSWDFETGLSTVWAEWSSHDPATLAGPRPSPGRGSGSAGAPAASGARLR